MFSVPGQPDTINKPDAIEEVTITQLDNFPKGDFLLDLMRNMFGEGLMTSDGERWYHQRKAANRFFSVKTLRALMMQSMQKNVFKMYGVIDSKNGAPVDLMQLFLEFTIKTFAEMGLGVDLNCIGAAEPHPFQYALDTTAPIASRRFSASEWLWKGQRALNVGQEAELAKQMKIVHKWLRETIAASLDKIASKSDDSQDNVKSVVELFIENAEGVKSDDLVDFLLSFVIAARDTTANTLSWMMFELARHPEIQAKIRKEMHTQLGNADRVLDDRPHQVADVLGGDNQGDRPPVPWRTFHIATGCQRRDHLWRPGHSQGLGCVPTLWPVTQS